MAAATIVNSAKGLNDAGVSTFNTSYTISAGSNRKLLVFVDWNDSTTQRTLSTLTYNGVSLTKVTGASGVAGSSPSWTSVELWYLDEASFPAPGAYNVTPTWSGATVRARVYIIELSSATQGAVDASALGTYTAATSNPTQAITTVAADATVFGCFPGNANTTVSSYGAGQTELQKHDGVNLVTGVSYEVISSPGSDTQGITYGTTASRGCLSLVSIAPYVAASAGRKTTTWPRGVTRGIRG